MRSIFLLLLLLLQPSLPSRGRTAEPAQSQTDAALRKSSLIADLQALEATAAQLDKPLARAAATAEIADAAWALDTDWAKRLLQGAYELTFPGEEAQAAMRRRPIGSLPLSLSPADRARFEVRRRVMSIASRDKAFAEELAQTGAKKLGRSEEHERYSELASSAVERGDKETAARYIRQAFDAEPTQFDMGLPINDLAARDRAAADKVIIEYIERLGSVPLSHGDGGWGRVMLMLSMLMRPSPAFAETRGREIPPAGPAAVRAYLGYMLNLMAQEEQARPGSIKARRGLLLSLWPMARQHAPELTGRFRELELLSRSPGEEVSWPPPDAAAAHRRQQKERLKNLLDGKEPDAEVISLLIDRGEFAGARKLLDKLADGPQKTDLANKLDAKESVALTKTGDTAAAQALAARLTKATYILQAYPAIIEKCLAGKDKPCATNMVYQAIRQLKQADVTPPVLPPGVPTSALAGGEEFDPVLSSLCQLAQLILPADASLASEALSEMVAVANASRVDTGLGRAGFDAEVFRKIAQKDEMHARQSAMSLKDPLRQVVSLAALYRWKAEEMGAKAAAAPPKKADAAAAKGGAPPAAQ